MLHSFSHFFSQPSFFDRNFICYQLYLFIKDLIFVILCGFFFISSWFNAAVTTYWKCLLCFFIDGIYCCHFVFDPIKRIYIYMIHQDSDLFYDIYNTVNEHNWRQDHYFSLIRPTYFDISFLSYSKSSSITSSVSSFIIISILSLFEFISRSSSLSSL